MENINYIHTKEIHNTTAAEEVLPFVFNLIKPESVLDVGCGTGSWLKVAKRLGVKYILGVDGVDVGSEKRCIKNDEFKQHNLTLPLELNARFDLAICLEVAEHLPDSAADNLVYLLTQQSNIILFSGAIPGQGGQGHINEQWPDYWQAKFLKNGYVAFDILRDTFWNNENVDLWYKQNMFIFSKPDNAQMLNALPVEGNILSRVHPQLFEIQLKRTQVETEEYTRLISSGILEPNFITSLKLLLKSIIRGGF